MLESATVASATTRSASTPHTTMLLGIGDELDTAITRSLVTSGSNTLVAVSDGVDPDTLHQPADSGRHWNSIEESIDESTVRRLFAFLRDQEQTVTAVVIRIDIDSDQLVRTRRFERPAKRLRTTEEMLRSLRTMVAATELAPPQTPIVLVFHAHHWDPRRYQWLEHILEEGMSRERRRSRINTVVHRGGDSYAATAETVDFLCTGVGRILHGSVLVVDPDGRLASELPW